MNGVFIFAINILKEIARELIVVVVFVQVKMPKTSPHCHPRHHLFYPHKDRTDDDE